MTEKGDRALTYAHSMNSAGNRHDLVAHLRSVASTAAEFAEPFGGGELARYLGLWHDLGKFHPAFQRYLRQCEAGKAPPRGPDHKAAGARAALDGKASLAALVIQGHHGGLHEAATLEAWVAQEERTGRPGQALQRARQAMPELAAEAVLPWPDHARQDRSATELFLRMVFSAVVDADYLDTERHFHPDRSDIRETGAPIAALLERFNRDQRRFDCAPDTEVNRARRAVYEACVTAATQSPGLFRLTVPTGGGKTRSSMAFALNHALCHGQQRVIVAVPYLTITEQTTRAYRDIFEKEGDSRGEVVLEHHSGAPGEVPDDDNFSPAVTWQRLAAENWDAPVIVTTTVQLFESLFGRKPSTSRKLHRLANSVIILDEAQTLPPTLLTPILDVLGRLSANYNCTVVFSTATQPAFQAIKGFSSLRATEIVPSAEHWFDVLRRVAVEWSVDAPAEWDDLARLIRDEKQVLAVVNTKRDASELLDALDGADDLMHLSTALCGAHRRNVIVEMKRRLHAGEPCRVVSTQVIEAGVDIDFPFVVRALGPLDSIVQSAGRCNREGRLPDLGRVLVVRTPGDRMPPGAYKKGAEIARWVRGLGHDDPVSPGALHAYFSRFLGIADTDDKRIQPLREAFDFPRVAEAFRMIDEDTVPVVVTQYGADEERRRVREWLEKLRRGRGSARQIHRALQPYIVNIRRRECDRLRRKGLVTDATASLAEWHGRYDRVRGLVAESGGLDALVV